jgi:hypothetical protein
MSKTIGLVCALALAASATALASPTPSNLAPYLHQARTYHVYKCWAHSPVAYGYSAWVSSLSLARAQALAQCAVRTPRGMVCYITSCQ